MVTKCSYIQLGFQNQSSQRIYINTPLVSTYVLTEAVWYPTRLWDTDIAAEPV